MLINSLDQNNDSPSHLAAYRKRIDILILLAKKFAFLNQPNAAQEDPIQAIPDKRLRAKALEELLKLPLKAKNKRHLQTLKMMEEEKGEEVKKEKEEVVEDKKEVKKETKNEIRKSKLSEFDDLMQNGDISFLPESPQYPELAKVHPEPNSLEISKEIFDSNEDEFELMNNPVEIEQHNSQTIGGIFPGKVFFYLLKTTQN